MKKINQKSTHPREVSAILLTCLVLVAFFSIMPISAYAETTIPDATNQFYVNDFADVFTDEEEGRLMETAVSLAEEHDGIQVVVTTIESLSGDTMEHYALEMYNKYGIGKNDMGLLILLSTGDREIRVEVGRAMEAYITDSKAGRFIDNYAIPYLAENKFNEGLINLQEAYVKEILSLVEKESVSVAPVPNQPDTEAATPDKNSSNSGATVGKVLAFLTGIPILGGFFALIVNAVIKLRKKINSRKEEVASLKQQLENEQIRNTNLMISHESELKQIASSHSRKVDSLNQTIRRADEKYNSLQNQYNSLEEKNKSLQERLRRVEVLHPEIDQEISDMIAEEIRQKDMAEAKKVDDILKTVINLTADKNIVNRLRDAISEYSQLSTTQKSYVTCDISKVNALYDASRELKRKYDEQKELERRKSCAATALASINAIIACMSIGRASDLSKLRRAKSIYNNLDSGSRSYFDSETAQKLQCLITEAEGEQRRIDAAEAERRRREEAERQRRERERREQERRERERRERERREREEEERRRRQRMQSSSYSSSSRSSFSSSRSHSGFGGRSGGGGAGRRF